MRAALAASALGLLLAAASATRMANVSQAACQAECDAAEADCKTTYQEGFAACQAMHGCGLPGCTISCTFGCAQCDSYWGHYIDNCGSMATDCVAECGDAPQYVPHT
ncbi:hypothetical protein P43SY_006180 [Pythium insidiosum]|uniref:Uncharacterized protein n=1 Tax=Pythium insidiosum TaxID=114742 RepID=A0AAD5M105_PYTIN|nr:hypothetical protein P43SY_006180 [Pythium insidiosum]